MLYLKPGEKISAEAIANAFDHRSTIETGYLDKQLVFQVSVWGGLVGYIAPPIGGSIVWGLNLSQGALNLTGYYREVMRSLKHDGGVIVEPKEIPAKTMIEEDLVWDLEFFSSF